MLQDKRAEEEEGGKRAMGRVKEADQRGNTQRQRGGASRDSLAADGGAETVLALGSGQPGRFLRRCRRLHWASARHRCKNDPSEGFRSHNLDGHTGTSTQS
jgi:hypothetical protein